MFDLCSTNLLRLMPSAAPKPRPSVPSIADVLSPKRVATPDQPCHGCRRSAIKSSRNLVMVTRKLRWEGKRCSRLSSTAIPLPSVRSRAMRALSARRDRSVSASDRRPKSLLHAAPSGHRNALSIHRGDSRTIGVDWAASVNRHPSRLRFPSDTSVSHLVNLQAPGVVSRHECSRNRRGNIGRSEEHTSELQSLMRISYAVFCLKQKKSNSTHAHIM